jgi:hypothetical protein
LLDVKLRGEAAFCLASPAERPIHPCNLSRAFGKISVTPGFSSVIARRLNAQPF